MITLSVRETEALQRMEAVESSSPGSETLWGSDTDKVKWLMSPFNRGAEQESVNL